MIQHGDDQGIHGLEVVQAVLGAINAGADADDALHLVVDSVRELVECSEAMILLGQEGTLRLRAASGVEQAHLPRLVLADGTSIEDRVLQQKSALFIHDTGAEGYRCADMAAGGRIVSLAAVPVRLSDRVVGVLEVGSTKQTDYRGKALLLAVMADTVALVVQRTGLPEQANTPAVDAFVRGVTHDLKSPLTAILGHAQLSRRRAKREGRPADVQTAGIIIEQAERMTAALNALRDVALNRAAPSPTVPDDPEQALQTLTQRQR